MFTPIYSRSPSELRWSKAAEKLQERRWETPRLREHCHRRTSEGLSAEASHWVESMQQIYGELGGRYDLCESRKGIEG